VARIDWQTTNARALAALESLVMEWLPGEYREGAEWRVGSLTGEPGRSLAINLRTGLWCDFETLSRGSDPISLLAAIRSCSMLEAARELEARLSSSVPFPAIDPRPQSVKAQQPPTHN